MADRAFGPAKLRCPIAQLAERLTLDQEVSGSNPDRATPEKRPKITPYGDFRPFLRCVARAPFLQRIAGFCNFVYPICTPFFYYALETWSHGGSFRCKTTLPQGAVSANITPVCFHKSPINVRTFPRTGVFSRSPQTTGRRSRAGTSGMLGEYV